MPVNKFDAEKTTTRRKKPKTNQTENPQNYSSKLLFVIHNTKIIKIDNYIIEKVYLEDSEGNTNTGCMMYSQNVASYVKDWR